MSERPTERTRTQPDRTDADSAAPTPAWQEPKLEYVEPQLVKHGGMKQITGFIGTFVPED